MALLAGGGRAGSSAIRSGRCIGTGMSRILLSIQAAFEDARTVVRMAESRGCGTLLAGTPGAESAVVLLETTTDDEEADAELQALCSAVSEGLHERVVEHRVTGRSVIDDDIAPSRFTIRPAGEASKGSFDVCASDAPGWAMGVQARSPLVARLISGCLKK